MLIRLASLSLSFHKEVLPCIAVNSLTFKRFKRRLIMADPWPVLEKRKVEVEDEAADCQSDIKKPRGRRKMHALLLAYCGQGYLGLQRNFGLKTIEEDIMVALKKLDIINEEEFLKQQLVHFQRAARTDKGVSALRQVINLNMRDGVKAEDINQHLPEQIRILAVKRVTKGFNSKNSCDYRTYSYTCPSFAFAPKALKISEDYRISEEVIENLNKWASCYVGTHNYHNFTSGRKPLDPSCKRHIMSVVCQQPVLRDDLELVTFLVKGQSFMLHQIRKMIGVLMAIARGYVSSEYINKAFLVNESLQLPVAPGLGLLLEQVHYDWYNTKYGENGIHEKLDFQDVEHLVSEFREKQIYPIIIKEENENKSMLTYMETLDSHYEEYHNETSDIYSKVLPDNFVLKNDNEAEVKAEGLELKEEDKSDDTADSAEKQATKDTNHEEYHNKTSDTSSKGLSDDFVAKNDDLEVKTEELESKSVEEEKSSTGESAEKQTADADVSATN